MEGGVEEASGVIEVVGEEMVSEDLDKEGLDKIMRDSSKEEADSNKEEEDLEIEILMMTVSRDEMVSNKDLELVLLQEILN